MNESATSNFESAATAQSLDAAHARRVKTRTEAKWKSWLKVAPLLMVISTLGVAAALPASAVTRSVSIEVLPTQSVAPGGTAKYPFVVRSRGSVGAVTVSVSGEPAGASTQITSGGNGLYELAVIVPANAAPSLSTITIRTKSRAATKSAAVYLEVRGAAVAPPVATVPPVTPTTPPNTAPPIVASTAFRIRADNPEITVASGVTAPFGFTVDRSSEFGGDVTFSATGIPPGVSANFSPNPTKRGTTLYATASGSVPDGRYTITVKAAAGEDNVKFTSVVLIVQNVADFALDVPPTVNLAVGGTASALIGFRAVGAVTPTISLGTSGLPAGVSANFVPNPTFGNSTVVFTATSNAVRGIYLIGIVGFAPGINHTYTTTLNITGGTVGGFGLSVSPSAFSTSRGSTASFSLLVTPSGGFASDIIWSVSGLPSGPTVVVSGTSPNYVVSIAVPESTIPGTYVPLLTGTSGSLVSSVSITLTIT